MSPRVIDLSVPLENGVRADPPGYEMSIENMGHKGIIDQWVRRYKGPQRFLTERPSHSSGSGSDPQRNAVRCVCAITGRRCENCLLAARVVVPPGGHGGFPPFLNSIRRRTLAVEGASARLKRRSKPIAIAS
jgi:hypothetical protein